MRASFDAIESDLSVALIPGELRNRNNDALRRGVEALGWKGGMLKHNRVGCQMSGFCELGCAYDAKQSTMVTYIRDALSRGVQLIHQLAFVAAPREGTGPIGHGLPFKPRLRSRCQG